MPTKLEVLGSVLGRKDKHKASSEGVHGHDEPSDAERSAAEAADRSVESPESKEHREGQEALGHTLRGFLDDKLPRLLADKSNSQAVIEGINSLPRKLEEIKQYILDEMAKVQNALAKETAGPRPESKESPEVKQAYSDLAERALALEEAEKKVDDAQEAARALDAEEHAPSPEETLKKASALREEADALEASVSSVGAEKEAIAHIQTRLDAIDPLASEPSTEPEAAPKETDEERALKAAEKAAEQSEENLKNLRHELGIAESRLRTACLELRKLTTPQMLDPKITSTFNAHDAQHVRVARAAAANKVFELQERVTALAKQLSPTTGKFVEAEDLVAKLQKRQGAPKNLKEYGESLAKAYKFIVENPEESQKMNLEESEEAAADRVDELEAAEIDVPEDAAKRAGGDFDGAERINGLRERLDQHARDAEQRDPRSESRDSAWGDGELIKGLRKYMSKGAGLFEGKTRDAGTADLATILKGFLERTEGMSDDARDKKVVGSMITIAQQLYPDAIDNKSAKWMANRLVEWAGKQKGGYGDIWKKIQSGALRLETVAKYPEDRKALRAFGKAAKNLGSYL